MNRSCEFSEANYECVRQYIDNDKFNLTGRFMFLIPRKAGRLYSALIPREFTLVFLISN